MGIMKYKSEELETVNTIGSYVDVYLILLMDSWYYLFVSVLQD